MLKVKETKVIELSDWDDLVTKTYNKPYSFQQQDDCKVRGVYYLTVPGRGVYYLTVPGPADDYENDTLPEIVNHPEMGVSFKAWLERDPKQKLNSDDEWDREHGTNLWWERNFYPDVQMIANDLHEKGLMEAGKYIINIDW